MGEPSNAAHNEVLIFLGRSFNMLFERRHKAMSRSDILVYLRVVDLKEQSKLTSERVFDFCDLISRRANLDKLLDLHLRTSWNDTLLCCELLCIYRGVFGFSCCSSCKIRLMLLALSMGQIRAFICVQRKTQSTFDCAQVCSQNVRILSSQPNIVRISCMSSSLHNAKEAASVLEADLC